MIEPVAPGIGVVALRTPTLAPATHTNTYLVGEGQISVFDPASPYDDEQQRLYAVLSERVARGERIERIVLTHHHADHVGGAEALRARFPGTIIAAHARTAARVADRITVDEFLDEGDTLVCGDRPLAVLHTPGHADGHLVFHDEATGAMIAGDMVAGVGTILIDPRDGELQDYLTSLDRLAKRNPGTLLPAHGPPLPHGVALLGFYIAHRHQRTEQIRVALDRLGSGTPADLVPLVYADLPREAWPFAAIQIASHLHWMRTHGMANHTDDRWELVR